MLRLCECGCGDPAPIATMTNRTWGHVKGQPVRFIHGHHQRKPRPVLTDLDLAWLAGLLEGEGSFIVQRRRRTPSTRPAWVQLIPAVTVGMTDADVIGKVADLFGSTATLSEQREGKTLYRTALAGYYAAELMHRLRPLMGIRRQGQIDRALAVISGRAVTA